MVKKVLDRILRRTDAVPDLELASIAERAAVSAASRAIDEAQERYDEHGRDEDRQALRVARDEFEAAEEKLARTLRLLRGRRTALADDERAVLERKRDTLVAELAYHHQHDAATPLAAEEAAALVRVAEIRSRRLALHRAFDQKAQELQLVRKKLGERTEHGIHVDAAGRARMGRGQPEAHAVILSAGLVEDELNRQVAELPGDVAALLPMASPSDYLRARRRS